MTLLFLIHAALCWEEKGMTFKNNVSKPSAVPFSVWFLHAYHLSYLQSNWNIKIPAQVCVRPSKASCPIYTI